ncbi:glycoside hydrolase family 1 protein [Patescibacteria group bacterium]|nr:glycoside hydrolase family 1 protein [Patescibacteria group bacterium]MBU4580187.1 glycoside hydrolase family 1 protein [Patescibacteria group bacterium]
MPKTLKFPPGFLWGSAVSSYQVEGGIENSDWSRDYPAGKACDYYNRYEKYFDLAKELGQNIHRFSIEWSRIEPEEGKFDKAAVEHYKKMLLALRQRNIKSMVTIWHWTNPLWFARKGGWENSKSSEYFARFVKFAVPELDNLVDFWATLNEPGVLLSHGYLAGIHPPHKKSILGFAKVYGNLIKTHNAAYKIIHSFNQKAKVGIIYNATFVKSAHKDSIVEKICVKIWEYLRNRMFLNAVRNNADYLGLNYYFPDNIEFTPFKFPFIGMSNRSKEITDMGWEIFPEGIYHTLKDLKRYNLPIYITENGIADAKDAKRAKFIIDHLRWMHKAISEGVDVRGYLYWSLLDNFEWTYGFSKRFGLIEMDFGSLEARIRPSALKYAEICKSNRIILDIRY